MRSWYNGDSIVVVGNDIVIDLFVCSKWHHSLTYITTRDDKDFIGSTFYKDKRTYVVNICNVYVWFLLLITLQEDFLNKNIWQKSIMESLSKYNTYKQNNFFFSETMLGFSI